jgi:hypothetical protein
MSPAATMTLPQSWAPWTADQIAAAVTGCRDDEALRLLAPLGDGDLRDLVMALRGMLVRPAPVCRACPKQRRRRADGSLEGARGLCTACYHRARRAGFPAAVPAAAASAEIAALGTSAARSATRARRVARFHAYCHLRSQRVPPARAARRVGLVPRRQAARQYEREWQAARAEAA